MEEDILDSNDLVDESNKREPDTVVQQNSEPNTLIQQNSNAVSEQVYPNNNSTQFSRHVDDAKLDVLREATATDNRFVEDFKQELKEATLKLAQVEKSKAEAEDAKAQLEKKNIEYQQELVETKQQLNAYKQASDKWDNKQKAREFHYNGVKDVMTCIGIKNPMCIPLLYAMFPIAFCFFLLKVVVTATFGNLLCGAIDADRPKAARGFLWTILSLFVTALVGAAIYCFIMFVILR